MVLTIGTNTWPIRLGDNATDGSGTYEIYFIAGGEQIQRVITYPDREKVETSPASLHLKFDEHHQTNFEVIGKLSSSDNLTYLHAVRSILNYWYVHKTKIYVSYKCNLGGTEYNVLKYPTFTTTPSSGSYGETDYKVKIDLWRELITTGKFSISFQFTMEK